MTKNTALVLGVVLMFSATLGFAFPSLLGLRFTATVNFLYLASGLLAIFAGTIGSTLAARTFCLYFGTGYGLLGVAGLLGKGTDHVLTLIPNQLVFATEDHVVHLMLGTVLLLAGLYNKYEEMAFRAEESTFTRLSHHP